jgi:lipopolysaccharide export system protein LptA
MKFTVPVRLIVPAAALLCFGAPTGVPAAGQVTPAPRKTASAPAPQRATAAPAPEPSASDRSGFSHLAGFDHIQTDDVKYNLNTGEFSLKDRFTAVREGMDITADSGAGNSKKKQLHAQGHVIVHSSKKVEGKGAGAVTEEPSTLTCDKLDVDGGRKLYTASGSVHFSQEDRDATADTGTLDDAHNILHLEGHVHIRDKEQYLDADVVDYNTASGEMNAHGGPVSIRVPLETAGPVAPATARPKKKK